jgi:hypothetical protein
MLDLKQTNRWSKDELDLIKRTFKGEKVLVLYQIRDVLMQATTEIPKLSPEIIKLLNKLYLPDVDTEVPLGMQADIRNVLVGEKTDIRNIPPEVAYLHIEANDLAEMYLRQQLDILAGKEVREVEQISYKGLKEKGVKEGTERFVEMMAYLFLENSYIDGALVSIKNIANQEELSEEEKKKVLAKNSSK